MRSVCVIYSPALIRTVAASCKVKTRHFFSRMLLRTASRTLPRSLSRRVHPSALPSSVSAPSLLAAPGILPPLALSRCHTIHTTQSQSTPMSTNAHDVDPGSKKLPDTVDETGDALNAADVAPAAAAADSSAVVARLAPGDRTRFLSQSYTIPFPPLQHDLSFDDKSTWPKDPMQVFSQWSERESETHERRTARAR